MRGGPLAAPVQVLGHLLHQRIRKARTNPPHIQPAVLRVRRGQQQRAEAGTAALGRGIADDRVFLAGQLLGLAPIIAATAAVRPVGTLGNDAFEVLLAGDPERLQPIALHMRAVGQMAGRRIRQDLLQRAACVRAAAPR